MRRADRAVLLAAGVQLLGQAEVADDDLAGLRHHQVGRLDVAVDHAVLVHVVQALEHLGHQTGGCHLGMCPVSAH